MDRVVGRWGDGYYLTMVSTFYSICLNLYKIHWSCMMRDDDYGPWMTIVYSVFFFKVCASSKLDLA